MSPNDEPQAGVADNRRILRKLSVIVLLMFGFGYAMVPIYKKICEVTGINFLTPRDREADRFANNTQVDTSRTISVEFDSNSRGAWQFKPEITSANVHPGEMFTVVYDLVNTESRVTTGQAIPSYAPRQAQAYFRKLQCFCFDQQTLAANTSRKFPVVFVIDPALPKDINTITLSYTYFEVEGLGKQAATPPEVPPAKGGG